MRQRRPGAGVSYARLVPSALLPPEDPTDPVVRRTVRDWIVDSLAFVFALLIGLLALVASLSSTVHHVAGAVGLIDGVVGSVAACALWWRRRWPVQLAVLTAVLSAVFAAAGGAAAVAMFTVTVHRRTSVALAVAGLNVVSGTVLALVRPQREQLWVTLLVNVAAVAIITAWAMFVRARRQLIWTLRARAERAEAEQKLRAEQARRAERTRIAREMHDVLAHRISLLALHAGGLEVRPELPPEQVRETASLLRSTAHRALEELRGVIGVLRDDGEDAPDQPQPRLRDVPRLVDEIRQAGAKIDFELATPPGSEPPEPIGRDAYRIVQEALTNVAKHAPGTATVVRVAGAPGADLVVSVRNRLPVAVPATPLPGSGTGLVGLQERVALAGGTITAGPVDGEFAVEARLAWP